MRVQGVAYIPGRPPAYCTVRDLSASGAFLEFDERCEPVHNFRLVIETKGIDALCEVRHTRSRGVGVMFDRVQTAVIHPPAPRLSGTELREMVQKWLARVATTKVDPKQHD